MRALLDGSNGFDGKPGKCIVPRLSIIVPFVGSVEQLENTLVSVLQNRPKASEVIVVLGQPYSDPYQIRGEVRFLTGPRDASLVQLANLGINASRGAVVHLLACGCEVQDGWTKHALDCFRNDRVASVVPVIESRGTGHVQSCGIRYTRGGRRFAVGAAGTVQQAQRSAEKHLLGPSFTAGFYRRSALAEVCGFDAALEDAGADVDMALALQTRGYCTQLAVNSRIVGPVAGRGRCHFRAGRRAEWLYRRHVAEDRPRFASARHLCAVTAELCAAPHRLGSWLHLAGRIRGRFERVPERPQAVSGSFNVLRAGSGDGVSARECLVNTPPAAGRRAA